MIKNDNRQQDYFACIIDWKMPDMDGIATTRAIRVKAMPMHMLQNMTGNASCRQQSFLFCRMSFPDKMISILNMMP